MSRIDFVTREIGSPKLISSEYEWDYLDTEKILQDYPYIIDSMEKEEYYLENILCSFFDEILFEDKVVGFATFQVRKGNVLLLTECFILPEFRGNRLFFDELCKMHFVGSQFGILQPTRNVVDLLLDYAFAKNFNEDIVVSAIDFYFDDCDAKSTKNRELDDDEMEASNFYDLSINSTIFVDGDEVIYHYLLENDFRKYGNRKRLDETYFTNIITVFSDNEDELNGLIPELKQELPQVDFGFNEIVGHGEGLSEVMQSFVDEGLLTYDGAIGIKEQLTKEYDSGEITDGNVEQRFFSLVAEGQFPFENINEFKEFLDSEDIDDEDLLAITDFLDLIGENKELGDDLLKAALSHDSETFQSLMMKAMNDDEEFMDKFINLVDKFEDEDDELFIDETPQMLYGGFGLKKPKYKLDDTMYGKDCPLSLDFYIYKSLKYLQKCNELYSAVILACLENDGIEEILAELLVMEGFVNDSVDYDNWNEFANNELTVPDLKKLLKKNNLKVSGRKQELINRVIENNVSVDEFKTNHVIITEKGYNHLEKFKWICFYEQFLSEFDFDDFCGFYETHEGKLNEVAIEYLDVHIKIANKTGDAKLLSIAQDMRGLIMMLGQKFLKMNGIE